MLCMHHIIPNRYTHPSGSFYRWLFAPDHGGNRTTKVYLSSYTSPFSLAVYKTQNPNYFPQCILLKNTIWSYSTTHFDWSLISGQLYTGYCLIKTQAREWRWNQWGCRFCRLGWWREFDGGSEHFGSPNFDAVRLDWAAYPRCLLQSAFWSVLQSWWYR